MSWKTNYPNEIIALDREEYTQEEWDVYTNLFCKGSDVEVIHIQINKIEYYETN